MPEVQKIKITDPAHASIISEWVGLTRAEAAIEAQKMGAMPGYALAAAIVAREVADARAQAMTANLKAVAKAGIDIVLTKNISLIFEQGIPVLQVELMDLADIASSDDA